MSTGIITVKNRPKSCLDCPKCILYGTDRLVCEEWDKQIDQINPEWCSIREIPDDKWFSGNSDIRPQDKQLCVVIPKWCDGLPMIAQYRHKSVDGVDCFHILGTMSLISRFQPSDIQYQAISHIRFWKPLWFPADVNKLILAEIEKWFEKEVIK